MWLKVADENRLVRCFQEHERHLEPYSSQHRVNKSNWTELLGDYGYLSISNSRLYGDYLEFFDAEINGSDYKTVFREYIPMLIPSLIQSATHPFIHLGYGIEFESPLVVAEGLAFACISYRPGEFAVDGEKNLSSMEVLQLVENNKELQKSVEIAKHQGRFGGRIMKLAESNLEELKHHVGLWNTKGISTY